MLMLTPENEAAILAAIEEGLAICRRSKPEPTDQELDALLDEWIGGQEGILTEHLRGFARAVLQKWGR
jgi:hypothetical protein